MPLCNRFRSLINKRMKIPLLLVCTIEVNRMRRIHQLQNLSFTVTLTQDAAARFLKRVKNVKLADKDCKKLTTEIVQSVVNKIANNHAPSFLRGTNMTAEQRRAYLRAPTAAALSTTSNLSSYDMLTPGETQARRV